MLQIDNPVNQKSDYSLETLQSLLTSHVFLKSNYIFIYSDILPDYLQNHV